VPKYFFAINVLQALTAYFPIFRFQTAPIV
jgi:hypothetical protein